MASESNSNPDNSPIPGEAEIKSLLERFQPSPGARFYQKIQSAPWQRTAIRQPAWRSQRLVRPFALAVLVLLIVTAAGLIFPGGRGMARQVLHFFIPEVTDTLTVPVTIQPGVAGTPAFDPFALNREQAQQQVGFELKDFTSLPDDLSFNGAQIDQTLQAVSQRYTGKKYTLFFTQRRLGKIQEYSTVGASAPVEIVEVRGVQGEFVPGGWRTLSAGSPQATPGPGSQVLLGIYWDPDLPQQTLRWQEAGYAYEILINGEKFDKDFLLQLAKEIK